MKRLRILRRSAVIALLLGVCLAPVAVGSSVSLKRANRTIVLGDATVKPDKTKTLAQGIASSCKPSGRVEFRKSEVFAAVESGVELAISVVRFNESPSSNVTSYDDRGAEACLTGVASNTSDFVVNPSRLWCSDDKPVVDGGLVYIDDGTNSTCLEIANARWLNYGSDYGFALNLVDREGDDEAFDVQEGFSGYWALSTLKSRSFRPVVNLSLLNFDTEGHDLEVGLGVGFIFKPSGVASDSGKGFSIGVGYGRNLMIQGGDNPGYWFIGLGLNIPTAESSIAAAE